MKYILYFFTANTQSPSHYRRESPDSPDFPQQNQQNHAIPSQQQNNQNQQSSTSALFGALKGGALGFMGKVKDASSKVMETVSA